MRTVERIHNAAKAAAGTSLDRPVFLDRDLGLDRLVDFDSRKKVYVDVPVASVVALGRQDFWSPGDTWRSVTNRLHCHGWTDEVLDYFESPTGERFFPAPGSNHPLRLIVYGGVAECGNGNHRLVAARAWLTNKYGDDAVLKGARISAYAVRASLTTYLKKAVDDGMDVLIATPPSDGSRSSQVNGERIDLLLKSSGRPCAVHALVGDCLIALNSNRTFLQRWMPRFFPEVHHTHDWRVMPVAIIKMLLEDSWLTVQLDTAKTWD